VISEVEFVRRYGFCPNVTECLDSNGCEGKVQDYEYCKRCVIKKDLETKKEKVQFD
jgi:hypothetical protein